MATLLAVDDEPDILYALERDLATGSLQVLTARTAGEAIERVRQVWPDVVLLDVRLPDMTGLDALARIRQLDPHMPVLILTASADAETAIEAMKRGAFEYFLKPVNFQQLRDTVARALDARRLAIAPPVSEAKADGVGADYIVGSSAAVREVYRAIALVAPRT